MIARSEPSGDKSQLQSGSICGGSVLLPLLTSNLNVSAVFPFVMLYRQIVDGRRAHCTFQMRTSLRTRRGVPPRIGMAKMEERVSGPRKLGVEVCRMSEPSGATLGCESWSALFTRLSASSASWRGEPPNAETLHKPAFRETRAYVHRRDEGKRRDLCTRRV